MPQTLASVDYLLHMGLDRKDRRSGKIRRLDAVPLDDNSGRPPSPAGSAQESGDERLEAAEGGVGAEQEGGVRLPADELMLEIEVHHPEVCCNVWLQCVVVLYGSITMLVPCSCCFMLANRSLCS